MNKILSIFLLVMLCLTSVVLFSTRENAVRLPPDSSSGSAQVGGAFSLLDTEGKAVSDAAFRGKYMLVFFGFTHCPDICPTTLATFTSALPLLGDKAALVTPIFISVDAKNDTPVRMKEYLANFDARIVGLTGSEEQIKQAASAYKAYYAAQQPKSAAHGEHDEHAAHTGMVDHSALIYLMNPQGEYITHFPYDVAPDMLVKKLLEKITP